MSKARDWRLVLSLFILVVYFWPFKTFAEPAASFQSVWQMRPRDVQSAVLADNSDPKVFVRSIEAAKKYQRNALELGRVTYEYADSYLVLYRILRNAGRFDDADKAISEAIDVRKLIVNELGWEISGLIVAKAELHSEADRKDATVLYLEAWNKSYNFRKYDSATDVSLSVLSDIYLREGRYEEGVDIYRKAIGFVPIDTKYQSDVLSGLGAFYQIMGRYKLAARLFEQSATIQRRKDEKIGLSISLSNLGAVKLNLGEIDAAEAAYQETLKIRRTLGHDIAPALDNLGEVESRRGNLVGAAKFYEDAIKESFNTNNGQHAVLSINHLAQIFLKQNNLKDAAGFFADSLQISMDMYGPSSPENFTALKGLADVAAARGQFNKAAGYLSKATQVVIDRFNNGGGLASTSLENEVNRSSDIFYKHLSAIGRSKKPNIELAFQMAQWAQRTESARAVSQVANRMQRGSTALSGAIREFQDELLLNDRLKLVHDNSIASSDGNAIKAAAAALDLSKARLQQKLSAVHRNDPTFGDLYLARPLKLKEAQRLLKSTEILVLLSSSGEVVGNGDVFVWIIAADKAPIFRKLNVQEKELMTQFAKMRCGLDASVWRGKELPNACEKIGTTRPEEDDAPAEFPVDVASTVYQEIFGRDSSLLNGKDLIIVPGRGMYTVPFEVLVKQNANARPKNGWNYKNTSWLGIENALTVLPSVGSLKALRQTTRRTSATKPFIGFASPLFDGSNDSSDDSQSGPISSDRCKEFGHERNPPIVQKRGGAVEIGSDSYYIRQIVHQLPALSTTTLEVECIAKALNADRGSLFLGDKANVRNMHAVDLSDYKIVYLATHGFMPGELEPDLKTSRAEEAALALTPPNEDEVTGMDDDGLLTASDIAQLKMDANWVILSACNTGMGPSGEDYSSLVQSFFYAGTRAMLVSHWEVDSRSTAEIMVKIFQAQPGISRAAAYRAALASFLSSSTPQTSHPNYWAAFTLIGEGQQSDLQ